MGRAVEASRVLAFSDAIFAIAITLLTINLVVPPDLHGAAFTTALHRLLPALGAYALSFLILGQLWLAHHRIFGVIARVDYAAAFIAAMALQLLLWLDVTRPERRELLIEPVPAEVRDGFARALGGMLLVFGAIMPAGMFAPRFAHPAGPETA